MKLMTTVDIERSAWQINYNDRLLLLGSCFSDEIAGKLREYYFNVDANPSGTLYNPISIARHLTDDVVSRYSVFILTLGTAWVYVDKATGEVVDNCQKRPASDFIRRRMTVDEVVNTLEPIICRHPDTHFILTVSPIRHIKDGLHENNLSKGILLQAVERLAAAYFPSYEILLDELRDYRFYAADLMHPSAQAVEYIWERFADTYLYDASTRQQMSELHQLWLDCNHRMLHPESAEAAAFAERTGAKYNELKKRYPWI